MLLQLAIRDIVLIDRLELQFPHGLSVLTGETGAGKSILLDAFALALGVPEEARRSAAVLGANYPGTEWYQRAYNLVNRHAPQQVTAAATPSS